MLGRRRVVQGKPVKHPSAVVSHELEAYLLYLKSPFRIMWINFIAGIFRGLGAVLGATVVLAGLVWLMTLIVSFPLIGHYMRDFHAQALLFIEEAQYSDDFVRIESLLRDIAESMDASTPSTSDESSASLQD